MVIISNFSHLSPCTCLRLKSLIGAAESPPLCLPVLDTGSPPLMTQNRRFWICPYGDKYQAFQNDIFLVSARDEIPKQSHLYPSVIASPDFHQDKLHEAISSFEFMKENIRLPQNFRFFVMTSLFVFASEAKQSHLLRLFNLLPNRGRGQGEGKTSDYHAPHLFTNL
ncbi:MAG: hypothetical protein DDT41_01292 [candidate division WS2 bacterium]|nr:hypothetical protein [Candidatus Psychracetigena formicireducens]